MPSFSFSSIGDALSKAYDSARETVSDVTDKVSETVSDVCVATRDTVGDAAEVVSENASSAYSSAVDTLSEAAEAVGGVASNAYDSTREFVEDVASGKKEINYVKVVGCTAVGVGVVAAAPFTGGGSLLGGATLLSSLAGAGTVATAVGVGLAGAAVGASLDGDTKARKAAVEEGRKIGKAEHLAELKKLQQGLKDALESLKKTEGYFRTVIALHAVAAATACCDGNISTEERETIEQFIAGISSISLPDDVVKRIDSLYERPIPIKNTFDLAKSSGLDMALFDEVISLVVHADASVHPQEATFIQAWNQLKSA